MMTFTVTKITETLKKQENFSWKIGTVEHLKEKNTIVKIIAFNEAGR